MALAMPAGALQFVVMEKTKAKLNVALTNHTLVSPVTPLPSLCVCQRLDIFVGDICCGWCVLC
jgi:hypothetical protein